MNSKIWIGNDSEKRKKVLSLIDVEKYGGKIYFKKCTSIYFYHKPNGFDVRVNSNEEDKESFNQYKNKEIKVD